MPGSVQVVGVRHLMAGATLLALLAGSFFLGVLVGGEPELPPATPTVVLDSPSERSATPRPKSPTTKSAKPGPDPRQTRSARPRATTKPKADIPPVVKPTPRVIDRDDDGDDDDEGDDESRDDDSEDD